MRNSSSPMYIKLNLEKTDALPDGLMQSSSAEQTPG